VVCVGVVFLLHFPYLRLPFFWDEAGYYFPAALDLSHGHLIPVSTVTNPHPPLLALYLAAFIKVLGAAPVVIRSAMCIVSGTALYAMLLLAAMLIPAEAGLWPRDSSRYRRSFSRKAPWRIWTSPQPPARCWRCTSTCVDA